MNSGNPALQSLLLARPRGLQGDLLRDVGAIAQNGLKRGAGGVRPREPMVVVAPTHCSPDREPERRAAPDVERRKAFEEAIYSHEFLLLRFLGRLLPDLSPPSSLRHSTIRLHCSSKGYAAPFAGTAAGCPRRRTPGDFDAARSSRGRGRSLHEDRAGVADAHLRPALKPGRHPGGSLQVGAPPGQRCAVRGLPGFRIEGVGQAKVVVDAGPGKAGDTRSRRIRCRPPKRISSRPKEPSAVNRRKHVLGEVLPELEQGCGRRVPVEHHRGDGMPAEQLRPRARTRGQWTPRRRSRPTPRPAPRSPSAGTWSRRPPCPECGNRHDQRSSMSRVSDWGQCEAVHCTGEPLQRNPPHVLPTDEEGLGSICLNS